MELVMFRQETIPNNNINQLDKKLVFNLSKNINDTVGVPYLLGFYTMKTLCAF